MYLQLNTIKIKYKPEHTLYEAVVVWKYQDLPQIP